MDASLMTRVAALEQRLAILEAEALAARSASAPDRAIRIREACAIRGWSYSWAVRRWAKLGGFRDDDGKLKIFASALQRVVP